MVARCRLIDQVFQPAPHSEEEGEWRTSGPSHFWQVFQPAPHSEEEGERHCPAPPHQSAVSTRAPLRRGGRALQSADVFAL